jgi:hypothetical protein
VISPLDYLAIVNACLVLGAVACIVALIAGVAFAAGEDLL